MRTSILRTFHDSEGNDYRFHSDAFRAYINNSCEKRGTKKKLIELLAKETNRSEETVKGWIKGTSGPSDPDTINIIEDVLNAPRYSFRYPANNIAESEGDTYMESISDYERNTARKLYEEICDMIYHAEYVDEELALYRSRPKHSAAFSNTSSYVSVYEAKENQREQLILMVRKAAFDIPLYLRDRLINLINKTYDLWDIDGDDVCFDSKEYKNYLSAHNLEDSNDVRYLYSGIVIAGLYTELDEIFERYLHK